MQKGDKIKIFAKIVIILYSINKPGEMYNLSKEHKCNQKTL